MATPTAGRSSATKSSAVRSGSPGTGSPLTAEPTSRTPRSSSENRATAAVARSIPIMGIGQVGRSRVPTIMPASSGSASATVGRFA